ncbi:MAG TPA: alkaline phosphatase family protein [Bdellovibrionota bacterium]|nr:alkaline phosphatase family protein [Bdellovibrionota bacterium]
MKFIRYLVVVSVFISSTLLVSASSPIGTRSLVDKRPLSLTGDRLIFVSFDGAQHNLINQYFSKSDQGFGKILKDGFVAEKNLIVTPTLTAVSHISMITGEQPSKTGIVSNTFHVNTTAINQTANGFAHKIGVQTLWEKTMASGKKVGVLSYPGCDTLGETEEEANRRKGSWGIPFPDSISFPFLLQLKEQNFRLDDTIILLAENKSFSKPLKASFTFKDPPADLSSDGTDGQKLIYIILVDTSNDEKTNYDSVYFDEDLNLENGYVASAHNGEWFKILYTSHGRKRLSYSKVVSLSGESLELKLYVGSLSQHKAYPENFRVLLEKTLDPSSAPPDHRLFPSVLTDDDYALQAERFHEYFKNVAEIAMKEMQWDALVLYYPLTDEIGHQFYLVNPDQPGYSEERAAKYKNYIKKAYELSSDIVESITQFIQKASDDIALVVVSDHGMAPLYQNFYPNRLLAQHHFIEFQDGLILESVQKAKTVASGGTAHVYVNLSGREKNGVVPEAELEAEKQKLVQLFSVLKDPKGAQVFEHILVKPNDPSEKLHCIYHEDERVDLNHPTNTGDVVLIAHPGYWLAQNTDISQVLFEPAEYYGQHGYDPNHDVMGGIFYAYGKSIPKANITVMPSTKIFEAVSELLKLNHHMK